MLLNPRTPLILGAIVIAVLGWVLLQYSPMPGRLSTAHAELPGLSTLDGCVTCHHEDGLARGCLGCHEEIATQIRERRGFHHSLMDDGAPRCAPCHEEHGGPALPLISERSWGAQVEAAFRHPHVEFNLEGAHTFLECETCHVQKEGGAQVLAGFAPRARERSFLGLEQGCLFCHEDRHTEGLSGSCDRCHGQDSFSPTVAFDHDAHFPLKGGHAGLECAECHVLPSPRTPPRDHPFPFDRVRATTCEGCHESPHFTSFAGECAICHDGSDPEWASAIALVTPELHERTGFEISEPHAHVACAGCHSPEKPFAERYHDPTAPGYARAQDSCQGCHADPHAGQFVGRHDRCADCHARHGFLPVAFGHQSHADVWPLSGAHAGVACTTCHVPHEDLGVRRFAGTSSDCKDCHRSPHGAQFQDRIEAADCDSCHRSESDTFRIREFDHERETGFALLGAHARALCEQCHVARPALAIDGIGVERIRQFTTTPKECHSCHVDPHHGQFVVDDKQDCSRCHADFDDWKTLIFDHDRDSRFPLVGVHSELRCSRCHLPARAEGGVEVVIYRPVGRECRDCHDVGFGKNQR